MPAEPERDMNFDELPQEAREAILQLQRKEAERVGRYGHVRPPISIEHQGRKFVAIGSRLLHSGNWKTFHDFLIAYIATVLTGDWGNAEIKKPFSQRHPILQWYHRLCEFQQKHIQEAGKIHSAIMTGPVKAYIALAYDLYTLEHHALLQEKLIKRLKIQDQFQGARYETYVAAAFIRAGFDVELEDEDDPTTSHCEFAAAYNGTGSRFSVEAKSRHRPGFLGHPGDPKPLSEIQADVLQLLQRSLRKRADHDRIVFIDVNVPPEDATLFETEWFKKVMKQLNRLESNQSADEPWPPAFVFFTNHPYHYVGIDESEPGQSTLFTAINIPEFKQPNPEIIKQKYPPLDQLLNSVLNHTQIPNELE